MHEHKAIPGNLAEGTLLADERFLRQVATCYHLEGQTQQQIADALYCSRQTISQALQKAVDRGLVSIAVQPEERVGYLRALARDLRLRLGCQEVILVPGSTGETPATDEGVVAALADATALYVDGRLQDGDVLAVTNGPTILKQLLHRLRPSKRLPDLQVVSTVGFTETSALLRTDANVIADTIGRAYGGCSAWLPIPALMQTRVQREQAHHLPLVREVLAVLEQATLLLMEVSLVDLEHDRVKHALLSSEQLMALQQAHPVAEVNHWLFDAAGRSLHERLPYAVTGVEIPHMGHHPPKIILVAGTQTCLPAIQSIVNTGFVDVFITDHLTAYSLNETGGGSWERFNFT